jgi:putative tryptophan/tyrosine transport system substrate-binding protein
MMDRRTFALAGASAVALVPRCAGAQSKNLPLVSHLGFSSPEGDKPFVEALRKGLREVGLIDGQNVRVESRHASGDVAKVDGLIAELVALKTDVFVAPGPAAARALRRATAIPVVTLQLPLADPELFATLARPGGTVTGFSSMGEGLSAKRIEILKETLPGIQVVGVLHNATDQNFNAWGVITEEAARAQGLRVSRRAVTTVSPDELAGHFAAFRDAGATAVVVISDFITTTLLHQINRAGIDARMAIVVERGDVARAGALLSYGPDVFDLARRAGAYVEKILKGATAGELPVQLPTKFEFVLNLKTATALGLTIPQSILIRADEVIE